MTLVSGSNTLNLNCVSALNGATVSVPISILGAGSLSSILAGLGLGGVGTGTGTGTGTGGTGTGGIGTGSLTPVQCLFCSLCPIINV